MSEIDSESPTDRGGFFWFDPFGDAPADAEVSGWAGGSIQWGGSPSWPFEYREDPTFLGLPPWRPRSRHEPHFQFITDWNPDAPRPKEYARITITRRYVFVEKEAA